MFSLYHCIYERHIFKSVTMFIQYYKLAIILIFITSSSVLNIMKKAPLKFFITSTFTFITLTIILILILTYLSHFLVWWLQNFIIIFIKQRQQGINSSYEFYHRFPYRVFSGVVSYLYLFISK